MALNIWIGVTSTDYDTVTNWSLGHIPTTSEDVLILYSGTNNPITTGNVSIDGDLEIAPGAQFTLSAGDTLTFTENNKTLTIEGYLKLDGTSGSHAVIDFGSLSSFTMDISGYLEGNYADIENMNNSTPIDIEDGWIELFNCTIASDVDWKFTGAARCLRFTGDDTSITRYPTPTLTTGADTTSFTIKYSAIEMSEGNVESSSSIVQGVGKITKMGEEPRVLKIDGACLTSSWDVIEDFRSYMRMNYLGNYRKVTFMCGDQPWYAVSGYLELRENKKGPLWPKFYSIIIRESLF
jgi:hypothetical protein